MKKRRVWLEKYARGRTAEMQKPSGRKGASHEMVWPSGLLIEKMGRTIEGRRGLKVRAAPTRIEWMSVD